MEKTRRGWTYHRRDIDVVSISCSDETWVFFGAIIFGGHMGIAALMQHCEIAGEKPRLFSTEARAAHIFYA